MNPPLTPRSLTPSDVSEQQRGSSGYAPSAVPMMVHRQVLSELEGAQQHIQMLTQDNQRLQNQNQELLVEIDRVVKAVRRLQGVAELSPATPSPANPSRSPSSPQPWQDYPDRLAADFMPPDRVRPDRVPADTQPQALYSSISEPLDYPTEEATRLQRDSGGWWLILTVLLIVVTAFGTGFLIVRPFLAPPSGK